jgi:hypothetical protein
MKNQNSQKEEKKKTEKVNPDEKMYESIMNKV